MPWPLPQDYNEALQNPQSSFSDSELRQGQVVVNALGIPQPCSGSFADVYAVECPASKTKWAVKCFTREVHGLRERYSEISLHLQLARLPFTVDFQYLEQGIRIAGRWYPILKMHWVEGFTLNVFIRDVLEKPAMLEALGQIWLRMARRLREAKIGHGDLQHSNVLLVPGSTASSLAVKLIDYDGMWVPTLAKASSGEVGHPAYQHPQRLREGTYAQEVDRFSLLVIYCALRALRTGGRQLWERFDTGDNVLFRQQDFETPARSPLLVELLRMNDPQVRELAAKLVDATRLPLDQVPHLADLVAEEKPAMPATRGKFQEAPRTAATTTPEANVFQDIETESVRRSSGRKAAQARDGSLLPWIAAGGVAACVVVGSALLWGLQSGSNPKKSSTEPVLTQATNPTPTPTVKPAVPKDSPRPSPKPSNTPVKPAEARVSILDGPPGEVRRFEGMTGVYNMAFSPDGRRFLTAHKDSSVHLWDTSTGKEIHVLKGHTDAVWSAVFSPDGKRAVSASSDKTARLWDLETGEQIRVFTGHDGMVADAVFSPDGRQVLSGSEDSTVRLWDVESGREIRSYAGHLGAVYQVAFAPDGARIVSAGFDQLVHLWDKDTGKELPPCKGSTAHVYRLAFSADGQLIAAGGAENEVRIWRIGNRSLLHSLKGHSAPVVGLGFSADGRQLVSITKAGEAQVWDVASGRELGRYYGPQDTGMDAAGVSADGRYFLSAGTEKLVRLWRLPPPDVLAAKRDAPAPFVIGRPNPIKTEDKVVRNKPPVPVKPGPGPAEAKLPVPDEAAQKKATEDIREIYKADYAALRQADDRVALAVKLLKRGTNKGEELVRRFVCLREARDLAARGGDGAVSSSAIDELTETFAVDPLQMKTAALELAAKALRSADAGKKLFRQTLTTTDEAESADAYELAAKLLKIAQVAAFKSGDPSLRSVVTQRENRLITLRAEYAKIAEAVKTLAGKAEDAEANLTVGKFQCFAKEDWSRGLPMLARGQDATLAELARKDMENPAGAEEQAAVGQAWWTFADKQSNATIKKGARQRARHWLRPALPYLNGADADRIASLLEVKMGRLRLRPGLVAELFADERFERRVKGRLDYKVEYDWGEGSPGEKIPVDHFSIRWQGWLMPPRAGKYKLIVTHDDGIRLILDGKIVIDKWGDVGDPTTVEVTLSGQPHAFQLDFQETVGTSRIHFQWSLEGGFQEQTVPLDALYHEVKQERLLVP